MSMHKIPLTELEIAGLTAHGLDIGKPSQLSDAFRHGVKLALDNYAPQWIPVSERLPEHKDGMWSDPVIAMSDTGDVFRLSYCGGWQRTSSFMDSGSSKVTHWMPLPSAPEQQK